MVTLIAIPRIIIAMITVGVTDDDMAILAGVLNIMWIPLGTVLAIYTFWALVKGKLSVSS